MIRTIVCAGSLLLTSLSFAQVQDDFSDGNFTVAPPWKGIDTLWQVKDGRLQSNCHQRNTSFCLAMDAGTQPAANWEWWMRLDFNTSSANYVDVYLRANTPLLTDSNVYGYFVRIGGTADNICLYRRSGGSMRLLIEGPDGWTDHRSNTLRISVGCSPEGVWTLRAANGSDGVFESLGSTQEVLQPAGPWFGWMIRQSTPSFFEKHFFDDCHITPFQPDMEPPVLQQVVASGKQELSLRFSEIPDIRTVAQLSNYMVGAGVGKPQRATAAGDVVRLYFGAAFPDVDSISFQASGIKDMAGNIMLPYTGYFRYYRPSVRDLVINEVLYDPPAGIPEFVELYNRSQRAVDLRQYMIGTRDVAGAPDRMVVLSASPRWLLPGGYMIVCRDPSALCTHYYCMGGTQPRWTVDLPALRNDGAVVLLTDTSGLVVDEFLYDPRFHHIMANATKGVSLERSHADMPTQQLSNWHSAAGTAGYATPGGPNSQVEAHVLQGTMTVSPQTFSPDGDGMDDWAVLYYELPAGGYVGTVSIFDGEGRLVRRLASSITLDTRGRFTWDGRNEAGQMLGTGIYIIFAEIFNPEGKVKRWKLPVVVARKLN
ncbi:lamin tail domain-containing protein [Chitinophaga pendula]|uniref:lamin tail domain-containing protein n=1 Tax=Chitinophaga TaxID=79328 RepID=UPI000BAFA99A|nr:MULTISPECIES: lamin tail domain-containing protein [Chitinophaga]ASZ10147.1 hypothetical protein CK934_03705 [Chitinophaga sp. MD30]UCJ06899.1 lamin tail domain-containing protein [Chitinophaga pendula]